MKIEEIQQMLLTPKSLNDFIADIEVKTNKDKQIVCALYALSLKINQLDNALYAILSNLDIEANVPKLTAELTDVTEELKNNNIYLQEFVNKLLKGTTKK